MRFICSLLPAALGLSLTMGTAQTGHNYPTPPEPMDPQSRQTEQHQTATRRIDAAQVQQEADDLARMANHSRRRGQCPEGHAAQGCD